MYALGSFTSLPGRLKINLCPLTPRAPKNGASRRMRRSANICHYAGRHQGAFHLLSGHLAHEVTFLAWLQTGLCGKDTWLEFVCRADVRSILLPGF
jgi:hypothetical protein